MSKTQQPCRACHDRLTYSTSGLCWECRPAPQVQRIDATTIYVGGLGQLPVDTALQLAHAIADAATAACGLSPHDLGSLPVIAGKAESEVQR